jgi:hypothetical protein
MSPCSTVETCALHKACTQRDSVSACTRRSGDVPFPVPAPARSHAATVPLSPGLCCVLPSARIRCRYRHHARVILAESCRHSMKSNVTSSTLSLGFSGTGAVTLTTAVWGFAANRACGCLGRRLALAGCCDAANPAAQVPLLRVLVPWTLPTLCLALFYLATGTTPT